MFGSDQPIVLHLLDVEPAKNALEGLRMELVDGAYPLLEGKLLPSPGQLLLCCVTGFSVYEAHDISLPISI